MTRLSYYEGGDEHENLHFGRWEHNTRQVLKGKRGQKLLHEIEEALLSLPEPRLIANKLYGPSLFDGKEMFCVVGALAKFRGTKNEVLKQADHEGIGGVDFGLQLGMPYTFGWNIMEENDGPDGEWHEDRRSPEQRYEDVLTYVRRNISAG